MVFGGTHRAELYGRLPTTTLGEKSVRVKTSGRGRRFPTSKRPRIGVPVVALAVLLAALMQPGITRPGAHFVLTGGVTDTAPTPPDLFVAYAPLNSQGNTPGADSVQSFDTAGLANLGSAQVGAQPDAEAVSPDGGTVYVLNSGSDDLTPVDTLSSPPHTESTISLPSGYTPTALAVSPDGDDAYVVGDPTISGSAKPALWEVTLGGTSQGTLARTISLPSGSSPAGLALTPNGLEALVTDYSGGTVIPVNLSNGLVETPIGVGITPGAGSGPLGIGVTPNGQDAFVADSEDGSLSEISLANKHVSAAPLETGYLPQEVAVSPDGSTVWVTEDNGSTSADAGFVVPVSVSTLTVNSPIGVGDDPNGVAISPDGSNVYVADETDSAGGINSNEGSITVVPTSGSGSVQTLLTDVDPAAVLVTPDEAPVASFTSTTAAAGQYTMFDASDSYSLTSGGLTYSWNFGDGSAVITTTSPMTKHIYPLPGTYTVTLSVTDISGTSTAVVYTGQYVLNNGGPSAGQTTTITIPGATASRPPIAYVADSQSNQVTPILADPQDAVAQNDAGAPIPVGSHPAAIAITPDGKTAYVVNFGSDNVTPINTATDTAGASGTWIAVGSEPDAIAITPDGSTAYVTNSGDGTVSKIALSTGQVQATISVGGSPSAIAISPDGSTAYVTNNNPGYQNLIPIKLSNDAVQPGIPAGTDPVAFAITPDGSTAYVVDRGSNIVAGAVTPITLTTSPPTAGTSIAVGNDPDAVAISPAGDYVYVANYGDGTISQIEVSGGTISTLTAGADPAGVAVIPSGTAAYVADDQPGGSGGGSSAGTVSEFSVPAAAASPTDIPVGTGPDAIAITPDQAPVAVLTVVAAPATEASSFDASQSTFPSSPAASYTWNFGDGTSSVITTTPTTTHTYAEGGSFTASVTITDTDGTSTRKAFTGQTVSLNGGPSAEASQTVIVPFVQPEVTGVSPSSGQAGNATTLVVSGTNFFGITSVSVGANAVTGYVVNSAGTQISNVIAPPESAGSVDVTVANTGGTSAITPADVFTYLPTTTPPAGAPVVTALSVNSGPVAGGTGVTITGTGFTGATAVNFGTLLVTGWTVNAAGTQITAISPVASAAGTVDVTVTTPVAVSAVTTADAFTYLAPPTTPALPAVQSVSPDFGPTSGLTTVTVTGSNLTNVTQVEFGSSPAESFHSASATSLTAVSPAVASATTVDITVVTLLGTSSVVPGDAFTYESGVLSAGPVVSGVSPSSGPLSGGTTVVITGSNFTDLSSTGVDFGPTAAQFTVNSAGTTITASSPGAIAPQTVDVVVTNPLGSSTITPADAFTYQPDILFVPTVTSVSPQSGPQAGGTPVVLTGTDLANATEVWFGSTSVSSFTGPGTGNTIDVTAPPSADPETVSVTVTNPYGTSAVSTASAYTYLPPNPSSTGPQVTGVVPDSGPVSGGTGVTVTGTGFTGATAVAFGAQEASSFTVNSAGTTITAASPTAAAAGSLDVLVTAGGETSPVVAADAFTYLSSGTPAAPSPPVMTSLSPTSGPMTGGTVVTIVGANFTGATAVDFGTAPGSDIAVNTAGTSLSVKTPAAGYAQTVAVTVVTPVGHSAASAAGQFAYVEVASSYHALAPVRLLDTRKSDGGGPLGPQSTRTLKVSGVAGVPTTANAVELNLTVTDTTAATYATVFPTGQSLPNAASLTAAKGQTVGHLVEVPIGANDEISIFNDAGSSHVVVDLEGYYTPGTGAAGRLVPLTPTQVLNTAAKGGGGPLGAGVSRALKVTGVGGVPKTGVAAVEFDLTSANTTAASWAAVYPAGITRPLSSNIDWQPGQSASNLVVAPVGKGGEVELFNHVGKTNLVVVITGYITSASATTGSVDTPMTESVVLNTAGSGGGGPIGAGKVRSLKLAGLYGIPANATDVVVDITASNTTSTSYLTAYAAGGTRPAIGELNWLKGNTVSNLVVIPIGTGGAIDLYNHLGETNVIVSIEGFYTS